MVEILNINSQYFPKIKSSTCTMLMIDTETFIFSILKGPIPSILVVHFTS